jgi:hypothetical protein
MAEKTVTVRAIYIQNKSLPGEHFLQYIKNYGLCSTSQYAQF